MKTRIAILVMIVAVFAMLAMTGCTTPPSETGYSDEEVAFYTFLQEAQVSEENQRNMLGAQPTKTYDDSIQRQQLQMRMDRLNVPNKVGYVYLVSFGKVMSMDVVNGSVYSVNSLLTNPQQIVAKRGWGVVANEKMNMNDNAWTELEQFVVDSPDLDGTYGDDGPPDAKFYFTADGAYVETDVDYIYYDQPREMSTPPELVKVVD